MQFIVSHVKSLSILLCHLSRPYTLLVVLQLPRYVYHVINKTLNNLTRRTEELDSASVCHSEKQLVLISDISPRPWQQKRMWRRSVIRRPGGCFTFTIHTVECNLTETSKHWNVLIPSGFNKTREWSFKTRKDCACAACERKPYLRQAEAVTSFLLYMRRLKMNFTVIYFLFLWRTLNK